MTAKKNLCQRKKENNIEAIVREAKHVFEEKGYHNTSVKELCERVMISKTTFFNYFTNKAAILEIIADETVEEVRSEILAKAEIEKDPVKLISAIYIRMLADVLGYPGLAATTYEYLLKNTALQGLNDKYKSLIMTYIIEAKANKQINGTIPNEIAYSIINGCFLSVIFAYNGEDKEKLLTQLLEATLNFLNWPGPNQ
jgi:AcrR family transcriptional regulator